MGWRRVVAAGSGQPRAAGSAWVRARSAALGRGGAACARGALWGGRMHPAPSGPPWDELGFCACPSCAFLSEQRGQLIGYVSAARSEKRRASNVYLKMLLYCVFFPFFYRFDLSALIQFFSPNI